MTTVYVLTNQAMPGMIKIGRTTDTIEARMRQLDSTGLPLPFECFYAAEVNDPNRVERALHEAFEDHRIRKNREFFTLSPDKAKAIIKLLEIKDVTPSADVISSIEDQAALAQARKRNSIFRFSMVGIKPGSVLNSVFDDEITCIVKDDRWVIFRGAEESLSSSALICARETGRTWPSISGPSYWKYEGKTLEQLRQDSIGSVDQE